ncbi:MAG: carboxypeptidase M32, partial [Pseudomonadota bacterium]
MTDPHDSGTAATAFRDLMAFARETEALAQISGRLSWDQETVMPPGATRQRAEEQAAIAAVLHARRTDPRVGAWLELAQPPDEGGAAQLRLLARDHDRAVRVPADLATALARQTSLSQRLWTEARAADDAAAFMPVLKEIVDLKRDEAAALADGGDLYDALLDDYEPGATATTVAALFAEMRPGLVALREHALAAEPAPVLDGHFPEPEQLRLAHEIAERFGYDFDNGRMDKAVHPFSSGSGLDVRITTRTDTANPFYCLYSTIHEVGHATYEQSVDPSLLLTPAGRGVSMGVHESQSRIYENQLARSRAFTGWLYRRMREIFGAFGIAGEDDFHRAVNRVHRGYIRTESDEVQYNLHIMLRFDLERALIGGDLGVNDLVAAWNDRFEADFGYKVDRASHGVLQDVHWAVGLFGYFPTYALGNVYAGCLHSTLRRAVPDLDASLSDGDPSPATRWLDTHVQRHGSLLTPAVLMEQACGTPPT